MDNALVNTPSIEWVAKPNGVARVPVRAENGKSVIIHSYDRFTKEYVVYSYDSNKGSLNWYTYLPAGGYSSPAIGDGTIFLPCGYTQICGIDEYTGEKLWTKELKARNRSTPLFYEGLAYVGIGNKIYGFDKDGKSIKEKEYNQNMFFGQPCVVGKNIYFLGLSNPTKSKSLLFVYEINLDSMDIERKYQIGAGGMISCDSSGLVSNKEGLLFVGSFEGILYCIDTNAKKVKWFAQGTGMMTRSKVYVHNDKAYVGSSSGNIMAVNIHSGEILFNKHLSSEGIWCPPIVYENHLFVHAGVFVYVLNKENGEFINKLAIGQSPYTGFEIIKGKLFIAAGDPPDYFNLYSLRMANNPRIYVKDTKIDYNFGDNSTDFDSLNIIFEVGTADGINPENLKVDLSIWGNEYFKPEILKAKTYKISVKIPQFYRYGNYALLLTAKVGNGEFTTTIPVSLQQVKNREIPQKFFLKDFEPTTQENEYYSGAAIMNSVMDFYGKNLTQKELNEMGEYLDDLGIHSHHKWRSGATRMLHSSDNSLQDIDKELLKAKTRFN